MKLSQAAEEFLAYLQHEKGCSDLTVIAYRSDFRQFLEFLQSQGIPASVGNVTTAVARQYLAALSQAGYKPATLGRRLAHQAWTMGSLHRSCEGRLSGRRIPTLRGIT